MEILQAFLDAFNGTINWTWRSITFDVPWYTNYFWGLTLLSVIVWGLELTFPWRKNQKAIRKDFWMDATYMYFNFFVFAFFLNGFFSVIGLGLRSMGLSMQSIAIVDLSSWPMWLQLIVFFIVLDFVQWATHVALHKFPALWQFHKVHHSVEEMGFAAHLRYHWMENVVYKPGKTIGVMLLGGFEPEMAYIVHFFAITIGHLNHANIKITWGPLKYLLNNSVMHLYHHAKELPGGQSTGVNFGISLSIWDYIFRTNYIPEESGTIPLGFDDMDKFPDDFVHQNLYGFKSGDKS
jgi:sterol desaturase/sphingolipid hydroxylase (fatty acid hydroxylase superfamily)